MTRFALRCLAQTTAAKLRPVWRHLRCAAMFGVCLATACTPVNQKPAPRATAELQIQEGDLVTVEVTAALEDGRILFTTREQVAADPAVARIEGYVAPERFQPEEVIAGQDATVPGLGQAVLAMTVGARRSVTIPAEQAFGAPDPALRREFPCEKTLPRRMQVPAERFVQMTGVFPVPGKELELFPYVITRVAAVDESSVDLELEAENGRRIEEPFGTVEIFVDDHQIRSRLTPKLGADFLMENRNGRIVASDGQHFTVDFNPPVAGKALVLDLEIVDRSPAGTLDNRPILWNEVLDAGLKTARQENKPAVLVLYADWCSWCKRLLDESVEDPRIKRIQDRFVWLKINSDVEQQFKAQFDQKSFPMVVYFNPEGEVLYKFEGYKDGNTLYRELRELLETI